MLVSLGQQYEILAKAYREFGCTETVSRGKRNNRKAEKKREQVRGYAGKLFVAMNSDNPPRTQDEAIAVVLGVVGRVLSYLFPQYALAIAVAIFIWNQLVNQPTVQTATHEGPQ